VRPSSYSPVRPSSHSPVRSSSYSPVHPSSHSFIHSPSKPTDAILPEDLQGADVKSIAVIIRNNKGQILLSTEIPRKKDNGGCQDCYHLIMGKKEDKTIIQTCYEETAEESRLLPVEKNWAIWYSLFRPKGNWVIIPWYSGKGDLGKLAVFVINIEDVKYYWNANGKLPNGTQVSYTSINKLEETFNTLRAKNASHQYTEKNKFKWFNISEIQKSKEIYSIAKKVLLQYAKK
jgi:hypothetical protein